VLSLLLLPPALAWTPLYWGPDGATVTMADTEQPDRTLQLNAEGEVSAVPPERAAPTDLPSLLTQEQVARAAAESGFSGHIRSEGAWLDERRWLHCQWLDYADLSACVVLDAQHPDTAPVPVQPAPFLSAAYELRVGPGGWLVVFRGPEGHLVVEPYRLDPERGTLTRPLELPSLYDSGPLDVHFSASGDQLWLTTPCPLAERPEGHPCMGPGGVFAEELGTPWRWYAWSDAEPRLTLVRADLPPGAAPHPDGALLAWRSDPLICVGDPAEPWTVRCHGVHAVPLETE
jgi:hypothetical protein